MFFKLFIVLLVFIKSGNSQECVHKDFGNDGTVCVCNATHCDTVPHLKVLPKTHYQLYTTNKSGARFKKFTKQFTKESLAGRNVARINYNVKYQTIHGWGGAFTDAAGINIKSLDVEAQDKLMKSYFGKDGVEYSLCRVPIGGTDFSTRAYSYDDGHAEDVNLTSFKLAQEDYLYKIPLIQTAKKLSNNTLRLFSSAWTAPKWMKTNNNYNGHGFLKKEMYLAWAKYFLKFLVEYKAEGIDFWGITTGNEPINGLLPFIRINSVGWLPSDMTKWLAYSLCPVLRNSQFSDIKIIALDDQRFFLPWYSNILFKNRKTKECVDGLAVHWYYDKFFSPNLLNRTHNLYPQKFLLASEACVGDKPWENKVELGSWYRAELYIESILEDLSVWVTGWIDWNIALDTTGGPNYINNFVDSPILVNAAKGEFYKQPMFYALGHFSKFVPPGSTRLDVQYEDHNLKIVAFLRPDNSTTVVVYNRHDMEYPVTLVDPERGNINLYVDAKSINTFVYW